MEYLAYFFGKKVINVRLDDGQLKRRECFL